MVYTGWRHNIISFIKSLFKAHETRPLWLNYSRLQRGSGVDGTILHYDCNSYFASVELLSHPELKVSPWPYAATRQRATA